MRQRQPPLPCPGLSLLSAGSSPCCCSLCVLCLARRASGASASVACASAVVVCCWSCAVPEDPAAVSAAADGPTRASPSLLATGLVFLGPQCTEPHSIEPRCRCSEGRCAPSRGPAPEPPRMHQGCRACRGSRSRHPEPQVVAVPRTSPRPGGGPAMPPNPGSRLNRLWSTLNLGSQAAAIPT